MKIFTDEDVARLLPMADAIEVVAQAMRTVSAGGAEQPLRHLVPAGSGNAMGVMSGSLTDPACFGVKLVSLFPGNPARGLSSHRGAVVLFESETGGAVAMMDAARLTAVRTAAASAVATRALAPESASTMALIGCGEQAEFHLEAINTVRPLSQVWVTGRSIDSAKAFSARLSDRYPALTIVPSEDSESAVRASDIVCTVTSSPTPVLFGDWLRPGQHLNIVGASIPVKREVDDAVVLRSSLWVDYRPSAFAQAGELVDMIAAGRMDEGSVIGEIGEVLSGTARARQSADEITLYRSLGVIAQDLATADYILRAADQAGTGQIATL